MCQWVYHRAAASAMALLSALLAAPGCAPRQVPPPQAPEPVVPRLLGPPGPLAPGNGRVVLDVSDGPATAELVDAHTQGEVSWSSLGSVPGPNGKGTTLGWVPFDARYKEETRKFLCRTPCPIDLPYGVYPIRLTTADGRTSPLDLQVPDRPVVLRVTMGSVKTHGGMNNLAYGLLGAGIGGVIIGSLFLGLAGSRTNGASFSNPAYIATPAISLPLGAGLTVLSIVLQDRYRTELQPASLTQFELPADVR